MEMFLICRPREWVNIPAQGKHHSTDMNLHVVNVDGEVVRRFELMCSCLDNDVAVGDDQFVEMPGCVATHMQWVRRIELGELDAVDADGNAWIAHITGARVWFESLYGQGEGGDVSFAQFKLALETYMAYLVDPERRPVRVKFPEGLDF